jgi:hypothetical protein
LKTYGDSGHFSSRSFLRREPAAKRRSLFAADRLCGVEIRTAL